MKHNIIKGLLLLLLFAQCSKDNTSNDLDIKTMAQYWDSDFDTQRAFKLRLAFAKTVARAFADKEFARYFKDNYGVAKDNHFPELFFGLSRDEIVRPSGTTLYQHLKAAVDPEVFDLFGDTFLDQVLQYDPCVVIKLPDVFRTFDWDVEKLRPAAIAQIPYTPFPEQILGDKNRFLAYYFNGQKSVSYSQFDYFHVAVKYSEDYTLLDKQNLINEKAISFYEFLPQALECDNAMKNEIIALGKPHLFHTNMIVVNKMQAFLFWRDNYGFKGKYWNAIPCPGNPACARACVPLDESVLVVDSLTMRMGRVFQLYGNYLMDDTYTYYWTFWTRNDPDVIRNVAIPSLPHEWFETRTFTIERKTSGILLMPRIQYQATEVQRRRPFPVLAVAKDFFELSDLVKYSFNLLIYADQTNPVEIRHSSSPIAAQVRSTQRYPERIAFVEACDPAHRISTGQGTIRFSW